MHVGCIKGKENPSEALKREGEEATYSEAMCVSVYLCLCVTVAPCCHYETTLGVEVNEKQKTCCYTFIKSNCVGWLSRWFSFLTACMLI